MQNQILREALLALIAKIDIRGVGAIYLDNWDTAEYEFLILCLRHKIVTIREVRDLLQAQLLAIGRKNYEWVVYEMTPYIRYPDHCASPAALGFAIQHGGLTEAELNKLKFDHGETVSTFMKHEAEHLLDRVVRKLVQLTA